MIDQKLFLPHCDSFGRAVGANRFNHSALGVVETRRREQGKIRSSGGMNKTKKKKESKDAETPVAHRKN